VLAHNVHGSTMNDAQSGIWGSVNAVGVMRDASDVDVVRGAGDEGVVRDGVRLRLIAARIARARAPLRAPLACVWAAVTRARAAGALARTTVVVAAVASAACVFAVPPAHACAAVAAGSAAVRSGHETAAARDAAVGNTLVFADPFRQVTGVGSGALLQGDGAGGRMGAARAADQRAADQRAARRLRLTATASPRRPIEGRRVILTVRTRDGTGRAIRGADVRVRWVLPDRIVGATKQTGRAGRALFRRALTTAAAGDTVVVRVRARWHGQTRTRTLRLRVVAAPAGNRLAPEDLVYAGAFRLPGASGGSSWEWSGDGLTYYPGGDPDGAADGYPGSLFGMGHDWQHYVSEITIPEPVISSAKNPDDLPMAHTLQPFADVRGDLYPTLGEELRRSDIEYLPAQGSQTSGKLYLSWSRHMALGEANPTLMWCDLDLNDPNPVGPWSIGGYGDYVTTDYVFSVDPVWAAAYTPGKLLAAGRFRDGGQGAMGPSVFVAAPWQRGDPPPAGTTLTTVPLLLYDNVWNGGEHTLNGYHHSDEWSGAAWVTSGDRGAVIFAGTKGTGSCWYGFPDGTVWPDEPPYPSPLPEGERGWWSTGFVGELLFYDPADLAAVAAGSLAADRPQPYAALSIDDYLFDPGSSQTKYHVGAMAFDRVHGRLFVVEPRADGDNSIIHVWNVRQPRRKPGLLPCLQLALPRAATPARMPYRACVPAQGAPVHRPLSQPRLG